MRRRDARVYLDTPSLAACEEFLRAVRRSKKLHAGLVSPPATRAAFARFVARFADPSKRCFVVRERAGNALVGVVTLGEIVLGNFNSAYLGYYGFEPFAGRGYMTEAVGLVLDHAFGALRLHRVEANVQPQNARSLRLLERLGFRREGFSPRYLRICGRYRDHVRTALLAEEWRKRSRRAQSETR